MSVFKTGHRHRPWEWQVTGLCFILGVLLAASLQTVRYMSRSGFGPGRVGQSPGGPPVRIDVVRQRDKEIADQRQHISELEKLISTGSDQKKSLYDELQKVKILAGLTKVHGPGIVLSLQDSVKRPSPMRQLEAANGIVHDVDLQGVVNELGTSGAEAIAINKQRIVGRTSLRCVGPTIQINNVPLTPPYVIQAIGDPDTLYGGLNLPYGVLEGMRRYDPAMVKIEKKKDLVLPAYTGSTEVKNAKPVQKGDDSASEGGR